MPESFELTVVGGSFAGLARAHAAATRGLRTAVLDRRPAAGARPHTTGILVKEVADAWDVPRRLTRRIPGVRLYAPGGARVDLHARGYHFLATDTGALLRWWADEARRAGAEVRFGVPFRGVRRTDRGFQLEGIETELLVGADGARSTVAEGMGLGRNEQFLVGAEAELEGVRGLSPEHLHVFLDSQLARGYIGWAVPGVDVTQVGVACRAPERPRLDAFLARLATWFDLGRARRVGSRGGLIPVGGPVRPVGRPGVWLVGDAAGHVSPLTAGGIHTALEGGRRAGLAACDFVLDGGPEPWKVAKRSAPRFATKRLLRRAFDLGPPNLLYDLALRSPAFRAVARAIFFHHRELLSPNAWWDLVRLRSQATPTGR